MFLIFGVGDRTGNEHELADPEVCRHCGNRVRMRLVRERKWVTLFFVPAVPYRTDHCKTCPVCRVRMPLTGEEYEHLMNRIL